MVDLVFTEYYTFCFVITDTKFNSLYNFVCVFVVLALVNQNRATIYLFIKNIIISNLRIQFKQLINE